MHKSRDPCQKCKIKCEDVITVILVIAITLLSLGLLSSLFKPGDSGGGFIKVEGSASGSVTVGGLLDKEDENTDNTIPDTENTAPDTDTDTGEGTDTENNDTSADTDTTPGEDSGNGTETDDNWDNIDPDEWTYVDRDGWT